MDIELKCACEAYSWAACVSCSEDCHTSADGTVPEQRAMNTYLPFCIILYYIILYINNRNEILQYFNGAR